MAQTGDCTRKCKEIGEVVTVMKTRAAMEVTSSSTGSGSFKRRKLASTDIVGDQFVMSDCYEVMNSPDNDHSPLISENSGRDLVSRCFSSDDSSEFVMEPELRSVDLQVESYAEGYEIEISKLNKCRFSRETTPSSEISDELESSAAGSRRRKNPEAKMPAAAEIEEFFAAAEKHEQKRFADKYNYDVKKDVPLEGRYQWVRLKQ